MARFLVTVWRGELERRGGFYCVALVPRPEGSSRFHARAVWLEPQICLKAFRQPGVWSGVFAPCEERGLVEVVRTESRLGTSEMQGSVQHAARPALARNPRNSLRKPTGLRFQPRSHEANECPHEADRLYERSWRANVSMKLKIFFFTRW